MGSVEVVVVIRQSRRQDYKKEIWGSFDIGKWFPLLELHVQGEYTDKVALEIIASSDRS